MRSSARAAVLGMGGTAAIAAVLLDWDV